MEKLKSTKSLTIHIPVDDYYKIKQLADLDSKYLPKKKSIASKVLELIKKSI